MVCIYGEIVPSNECFKCKGQVKYKIVRLFVIILLCIILFLLKANIFLYLCMLSQMIFETKLIFLSSFGFKQALKLQNKIKFAISQLIKKILDSFVFSSFFF